MNDQLRRDYEIAKDFWNIAFLMDEAAKQQAETCFDENGWKNRAPSEKLLRAAESLGRCSSVLDYGCGKGRVGFFLSHRTKASVIGINKDGTYEIQAGIMKLKAKKSEIYLLENENPYVQKGRPKHSGREMKVAAMNPEVDLRGMDSVEAICVMDRYLDEAMRSNLKQVRIIHGKGTGVLRKAVHESLKRNKYVKKYRLGVYGEGEDGVTVVELK